MFDNTPNSLINKSIKLLQMFEEVAVSKNPRGYCVCYSGGKDSDVLLDLMLKSKVKFFVIHNHTTLDFPETVYYVRRRFYELELKNIYCKIYPPKINFWDLCIKHQMFPLRQIRFCCETLKEYVIPEIRYNTRVTGVRRAESAKRAKYRDSIEAFNDLRKKTVQRFHFDNMENIQTVSACYTNNYSIINPLAYWDNDYEADYIADEKLTLNPLYSRGFKRIGCMLCPQSSICQKNKELELYPKFKSIFLRTAAKILEERKADGKTVNFTPEEYLYFWINETLPQEIEENV